MLLMMGTAEALKEPQEKIVFVEDMSDAQLATAVSNNVRKLKNDNIIQFKIIPVWLS